MQTDFVTEKVDPEVNCESEKQQEFVETIEAEAECEF